MPEAVRVIFLTGAPDKSVLQWEEQFLSNTPLPCFVDDGEAIPRDSQIKGPPAWRLLTDTQHDLLALDPKEDADISMPGSRPAAFLNKSAIASASLEEDGQTDGQSLEQYYEHSITIHEGIPSSQVISLDSSQAISFLSASTGSSYASALPDLLSRPLRGHVADLKDIPNAAYLDSINPQTMTVNLIVGIIANPAARTIVPRRGGQPLALVEMVVGDESRAGFGVNLWLPGAGAEEDGLSAMATRLRPCDVVLMQNVALSSFRGNVYGQSLRRGLTKVQLLWRSPDGRNALDAAPDLEQWGSEQHLAKMRRVQHWLRDFVSGPRLSHRQQLPPDTQ